MVSGSVKNNYEKLMAATISDNFTAMSPDSFLVSLFNHKFMAYDSPMGVAQRGA
jgi:hypothetical protein